jgi:KipI family sensor histidine kinase inhibitor
VEHAPQLTPVGTTAARLTVEPGTAASWRSLVLALAAEGLLPPPADVVPAHRTVLVDGVDPVVLAAALEGRSPAEQSAAPHHNDVVTIPTVYDGEDLAEVARFWGVDTDTVVARHTATDFVVDFCGFAPGFAYLTGLDAEVPRHPTPRTRVPAGAVALAGRYCGIYPSASPGGWRLIGRTSVRLFDVTADPPALLPPGTRVRFTAVGEQPPAGEDAPPRAEASEVAGHRTITVVRPGALTTVQDTGRGGRAHLGVPRSGALDQPAARLANRLVGNPVGAAVLETTLHGVAGRLSHPTTVAVTGAPATVRVDGRPVEFGVAIPVPAGAVLDIGSATAGVRSYVAFAGGVAVEPVLGSRSTDLLSGLGPPPLAAGQSLPLGRPTETAEPGPFADADAGSTAITGSTGEVILRLTLGPDDDWFTAEALRTLRQGTYAVSPASNRVGVRLRGPAIDWAEQREMDSAAMVLGAVQVPPDGEPLVFLADHPTTGGYPVIGVVDHDDLAALAQARPGATVRFQVTAPMGSDAR